MKAKIFSPDANSVGEQTYPSQFSEPVRLDLIKRAVLTIQANNRQAYGTDPEAGKRASSKLSRRRRDYRGAYGIGISRVPRKIMSRQGTRMNWVAATSPNAVGGRAAHPPKASKILSMKLNDTERKKAIRSALAATIDRELVLTRGHAVPESYPLLLSDDFEKIDKTVAFKKALVSLGFADELVRSAKKTIRAGRGKARNRLYKKRVGPLVVVSSDAKTKSPKNIPGVTLVSVKDLNAELLAPGCHAGRATLFTVAALKELADMRLFQ